MLKKVLFAVIISTALFLTSFSGGGNSAALQAQVANLQSQVSNMYTPPFWLPMTHAVKH